MPRSLLPHTLRTTTLAPCGCSLPCAVGKNGLTATWVHDCFPFAPVVVLYRLVWYVEKRWNKLT